MPKKRSYITATDQFCGAGGSTSGAKASGVEVLMITATTDVLRRLRYSEPCLLLIIMLCWVLLNKSKAAGQRRYSSSDGVVG